MSAHRYWRLANLRNARGAFVSMAEVALCTTIGGSSVATGGTPAVIGSATGNAAALFDGNKSNIWTSNQNPQSANDWVSYDFGVGVTRDIVSVVISGRNDGNPDYSPCFFLLQSSDDNSTWTNVQGFFASGWVTNTDKTFNVGNQVANRYWKLTPLQSQNGVQVAILSQVILATVLGGATATGSGISATSSDNNGQTGAPILVDGIGSSLWSALGTETSAYYVYDFGVTKNIVQVRLKSDSGFFTHAPGPFNVQSSPDGFTWTTQFSGTPTTWSASQTQRFPPDPPVPPPPRAAQTRFMLNEDVDVGYEGVPNLNLLRRRVTPPGAYFVTPPPTSPLPRSLRAPLEPVEEHPVNLNLAMRRVTPPSAFAGPYVPTSRPPILMLAKRALDAYAAEEAEAAAWAQQRQRPQHNTAPGPVTPADQSYFPLIMMA